MMENPNGKANVDTALNNLVSLIVKEVLTAFLTTLCDSTTVYVFYVEHHQSPKWQNCHVAVKLNVYCIQIYAIILILTKS